MNSPPSLSTGYAVAASTSAAITSVVFGQRRASRLRPVGRDEKAVDRVRLLPRNAAADHVAHQHWHQRHGEDRRSGHRVRLRVSERFEQAPGLCFQREHGHERERDHQQTEEQSRADFRGRISDDRPLLGARQCLSRVLMPPRLDVLVRVFDHHHRRIDHRTDRDPWRAT
jgi:hypothetical protein